MSTIAKHAHPELSRYDDLEYRLIYAANAS